VYQIAVCDDEKEAAKIFLKVAAQRAGGGEVFTYLHVHGRASPLPIAKGRRNEIREQYFAIADRRRLV